jgi:N-acetylneuraminate synthase/N,N'-diacetyllegionaminate synthase
MEEVLQTVARIQQVDQRYKQPEMLCLMQCTSMYPIPDGDANLRVMDSFRSETGLAVGYSDHTIGTVALRAAAAMGAEALEFHFTDSRDGKTFRDHKVSLTKDEVHELRGDLKQIATLRGEHTKRAQSSELENNHDISFRRAAYLCRDIPSGEAISPKDIVCLRPCHGLDARDYELLRNAKALRPLKAHHAIDVDADILPTRNYYDV